MGMQQDERDRMVTEGGVKWFNGKIPFDSNIPHYAGGIALFNELSAETLENLIQEGYADRKESQNEGPTIDELLNFMKEHPRFKGEGYTVTDERDDFRLTLTGVTLTGKATEEELLAFQEMFKGKANEYEEEEDHLRAWHD